MPDSDSARVTIQAFLSRIETEGVLEASVQGAIRRLAENGRLSDQAAIETAIQQGMVEDEAETSESTSDQRTP